jgi:predicted phosphodiesterase
MKILCISDTHGNLPEIKDECDVFIHAGDICPATNHTRAYQSNWLGEKFSPWLDNIKAKHKIIIAGNHDWIWYDAKNMVPDLNCHYLEDSEVTIGGLKFYGSPWTPHFCDWAFNFRPNDWQEARFKWNQIPLDTDVLITHGPPQGHGDLVKERYSMNGMTTYKRYGCQQLMERVLEVDPSIHIFGHFHMNGVGTMSDMPELPQKTVFYNVSVLDEQYRLKGEPTVIELEL